jgi:hypothetical protein
MKNLVVPQSDMLHEVHVQASLDQLNTTFAQFLSAEADMTIAEKEGDRTRAIRAWHTKRQTAETYMQAWEVLALQGTILFDEHMDRFRFFPQT